MGYSPWGHKESDTTEQLTLRNHSRNVGGVCVCVCVGPPRHLDPTRFSGQNAAEKAHARCEEAGLCLLVSFKKGCASSL